ncbi:MAG: hypothetical protein AAF434_05140 [Pseudomonadota bacterium]
MDWMSILMAGALIMLIIFLWPRAKMMLEMSAQETERDWKGAIIPIVAVIAFVVFLMMAV